MKKTLFAMAALALCGTASAATYNASTLGTQFPTEFAPTGSNTLMVDAEVTYGGTFAPAQALKLYYHDDYTFTVSGELGSSVIISTIQADGDAEAHWGEKILEATGDSFTIVLFSGPVSVGNVRGQSANMTLGGVAKDHIITLGEADFTYLGYFSTESGAVEAINTLGTDAVALAKNDNNIVLVGKSFAVTPEPATATLSLLALAGLAARRRRH